MIRQGFGTMVLLLLLFFLIPSPAAAWDRTAPPTSEGPPWGTDRFQHVEIRVGLTYGMPFYGISGGADAAYAPDYAEGWKGGVGGFADLHLFFCPGHAIFLAVEQFSFPSVGEETVGMETVEFGEIAGTGIALGWSVQLPLGLETELWTCSLAPTVTGPVLFGRAGVGVALLQELTLTVDPTPLEGNPPWWDAATVPFAHVSLGFAYIFFRYAGVFAEIAGGAIVPTPGSAKPGAEDAGLLGVLGVRAGISVHFL
ncbi:MAG: hypothetical protein ACYTHM_21200 [Planctomycetota bacterium]|jgi:hypothetical protein